MAANQKVAYIRLTTSLQGCWFIVSSKMDFFLRAAKPINKDCRTTMLAIATNRVGNVEPYDGWNFSVPQQTCRYPRLLDNRSPSIRNNGQFGAPSRAPPSEVRHPYPSKTSTWSREIWFSSPIALAQRQLLWPP